VTANDATTDTPMSDGVRHSTTNPPAATTNIATRSTIDGSSSAVRINNREKNGSAKEKGTIPALNNGEKARNALPSGEPLTASDDATTPPNRPNVAVRFYRTFKSILLSSWINVLLVFVPIGIASECASLSPSIIFSMNAVAIIPLAGMLSYATESVARRMGDTVGALMNVTFGNAVELIIFIIALVKNEIRIVQASLLGSILANLLLILGMCFFIGGLRFREQVRIYNPVPSILGKAWRLLSRLR
jgi:Ca2+:H+ antiporter